MRALIIEDDLTISEHIKAALQLEGFDVDTCLDGVEGYQSVLTGDYDVAIIDLMLPSLDGLSLIERIRKDGCQMPVLIVSAKHSVDERIAGLKSGGDDYLVKPFSLAELVARTHALVRRAGTLIEPMSLSYSDIKLDLKSRVAHRGNHKIELRPREFLLLEYMLKNAELILSKAMILEQVWQYHFDPQTNVVDVLVCRLRNRLDEYGGERLIHTVRGAGYVLKQADSS